MAAKQSQEIQKQIAQHLKNINRYSHLVHQEPEESETDLLGEDDLPTNPIIIPPRNQMHREDVTSKIYSLDLPEDMENIAKAAWKAESDSDDCEGTDITKLVYSNKHRMANSSSSEGENIKDMEMLLRFKNWTKTAKTEEKAPKICQVNISEENLNESSESWLDSCSSQSKIKKTTKQKVKEDHIPLKKTESLVSNPSSGTYSQKIPRSIRNGRIDRPPPTPHHENEEYFDKKIQEIPGLNFNLSKKQFEKQLENYANEGFKSAEKKSQKEFKKIKKQIYKKKISNPKKESHQTTNEEWEDVQTASSEDEEEDPGSDQIETMVDQRLEQYQKEMADDFKQNPELFEDPFTYCLKKGAGKELQYLLDVTLKTLYKSKPKSSCKAETRTKTPRNKFTESKAPKTEIVAKNKANNQDRLKCKSPENSPNFESQKKQTENLFKIDTQNKTSENIFDADAPKTKSEKSSNIESQKKITENRPSSKSSEFSNLRSNKGPSLRINPSSIKKAERDNLTKDQTPFYAKSLKLSMMSSKNVPNSLKMALVKKYSVSHPNEEEGEDEEEYKANIKKQVSFDTTKKKKKKGPEKEHFDAEFKKLIEEMHELESESDNEMKLINSGDGDADMKKNPQRPKMRLLKDNLFPSPTKMDIMDIKKLSEGLPEEFQNFADLLASFEYVDKDDQFKDFSEENIQNANLRKLVDDLGEKLCRKEILEEDNFEREFDPLRKETKSDSKPKNVKSKKSLVSYTTPHRYTRRSSSTSSQESLEKLEFPSKPKRKPNSKFTITNRRTREIKKLPSCALSSSSGDEKQKTNPRLKQNPKGEFSLRGSKTAQRRNSLGSLTGWTWESFLTRKDKSNNSFSQQEMLEFRNMVTSLDKRLLRVEGRKSQYGPYPVRRHLASSGLNRKHRQMQIERENLMMLNRVEKVRPSVGSFR